MAWANCSVFRRMNDAVQTTFLIELRDAFVCCLLVHSVGRGTPVTLGMGLGVPRGEDMSNNRESSSEDTRRSQY